MRKFTTTVIQIIALLVLFGRAGAYECDNISGSEFALSVVICLGIIAFESAVDRVMEGGDED